MRILVVHGQQIEHYPPVRSLIDVLTRNGHYVTLITKFKSKPNIPNDFLLRAIQIPENDNNQSVFNAIAYAKKKQTMKKMVEKYMQENDILWTTTDSTVRDLGAEVLKHKHVMQLMELIEDMPAYPGFNYPLLNIKKYARRAYKVVVPEYNRAHIQKTWWGLKELPCLFPNKMSSVEIPEAPVEVKKVIENLEQEKRKIILYQGSFRGDRNLDVFAEAIDKISDEYVLYLMGSDSPERKLLCNRYPKAKYIPFVAPPFHLLVSQRAYIGLLPYVSERIGFNSELNALYCAPNKIFEFSGYGVPMIGNDVPGLTIPFEQYNIGKVRKRGTTEEIIKLIHQIGESYIQMSENCKKYYDNFDLDELIKIILQ